MFARLLSGGKTPSLLSPRDFDRSQAVQVTDVSGKVVFGLAGMKRPRCMLRADVEA